MDVSDDVSANRNHKRVDSQRPYPDAAPVFRGVAPRRLPLFGPEGGLGVCAEPLATDTSGCAAASSEAAGGSSVDSSMKYAAVPDLWEVVQHGCEHVQS